MFTSLLEKLILLEDTEQFDRFNIKAGWIDVNGKFLPIKVFSHEEDARQRLEDMGMNVDEIPYEDAVELLQDKTKMVLVIRLIYSDELEVSISVGNVLNRPQLLLIKEYADEVDQFIWDVWEPKAGKSASGKDWKLFIAAVRKFNLIE